MSFLSKKHSPQVEINKTFKLCTDFRETQLEVMNQLSQTFLESYMKTHSKPQIVMLYSQAASKEINPESAKILTSLGFEVLGFTEPKDALTYVEQNADKIVGFISTMLEVDGKKNGIIFVQQIQKQFSEKNYAITFFSKKKFQRRC